MSDEHTIELTVNGVARTLTVPPNLALLDALRDRCGLTGAKECCAVGECGACTVSVDGRIVNSCLMLAVEADGAEVTTVEGLSTNGELSPLQQAFLDRGAVQCGFCIPGMVMSAQAVLDRNPRPSTEEVREGLSGNLCRCAGYNRMFEAMLATEGPGEGEAIGHRAHAPATDAAAGAQEDAVAHGPAEVSA
ncbi:(2Fe-2S)-binding protein [Georgenia yuyongxinii]|uniref:(2Fe-2S)-binding protein n=1 Tax=Georgenia yuyongxinii TaxID=2589797 RepID=A0A552WVA1_9MICO|nr:(2Fe-2S)-binding protein [Georgenia yuyongxinii]TRW46677.1 (2Fe-2S)-binding protein [Georgenia yuyongxinii]